MRSALIALALLVTPALAQERLARRSKTRCADARLSPQRRQHGRRQRRFEPCRRRQRKGHMRRDRGWGDRKQFFECHEAPAPVVIAQSGSPRRRYPKPDICKRHGLHKVTRGSSPGNCRVLNSSGQRLTRRWAGAFAPNPLIRENYCEKIVVSGYRRPFAFTSAASADTHLQEVGATRLISLPRTNSSTPFSTFDSALPTGENFS